MPFATRRSLTRYLNLTITIANASRQRPRSDTVAVSQHRGDSATGEGVRFEATTIMDSFAAFFVPSGMSFEAAALVVAVSFVGSAITAALSIGGGLLIIAVMTTIMPASAVIPVHGAVMLGSNGGRFLVLQQYVSWPIIISFGFGAIIGALIGSFIVTGMPASALRLSIAGFIIFSQWGPKIDIRLTPGVFRWVGAASTILTLFVGATGPFVMALLAKKSEFSRFQITATAAACMMMQHGLKVIVFALAGFAFAPYLGLIILSIVSGVAGTVLGAKLLGRLPEQLFRTMLKALLTVIAIYLAVMAIITMTSAH